MKFKVVGVKNSQQVIKIIHSNSLEDAHQKAQSLGIIPIEIVPKSSFCIRYFLPYEAELLLSFRQIAFMLCSSIAITEVLEQCIKSSSHPKIRSMYEDILKSLEQGSSLSRAFSKFVWIVGESRIAIIEVGENTGSLPEVFALLAQEMEEKQKELLEFKKKLFYPCVVFVCTLLAFAFLNAKVLPEFIALFEEMSIELPFSTKALIISGDFFSKWGILALILCLILILLSKRVFRTSRILKEKFHQFLLNLPLFGRIFLCRELYRYFLGFYFCQKAGLDIKSSLKNSHSSLSNVFLKAQFYQVGIWIEKGENLSNALCKINLIDSMSAGLIVSGEKSGNLERMLQMCSVHYKNLYTQSLESFSRWLEPMMSVFVGLLVLWFALGILTPMWNLNSSIF